MKVEGEDYENCGGYVVLLNRSIGHLNAESFLNRHVK